jgi:hypothetical protein
METRPTRQNLATSFLDASRKKVASNSMACRSTIAYNFDIPGDTWLICLCGLVVSVPGYGSIGLGSISCSTDFRSSSGSRTESAQPSQYNCGAT